MIDKQQDMKRAAMLQVIASQMLKDEKVSVSSRNHAKNLFRIAAELIVESTATQAVAKSALTAPRLLGVAMP